MSKEEVELREARRRAHRAFDAIWMSGLTTRTRAYAWLQKIMHLKKREAHIARFTREQCEQLIVECGRFKNGRLS